MMGPLILGPTLSGLDVPAVARFWIATLVALATVCAMNSFDLFVCLPFFFSIQLYLYNLFLNLPI